MQTPLRVLNNVSWRGQSIPGSRSTALLHALVAAGNHGGSVTSLVDAIWEDDPPSNPRKALQVLVSRLRSTTSTRIIERTTTGYRLGLNRDEVDILARNDLSHDASALYSAGHLSEAAQKAQLSLEIGPSAQAHRILGLTASSRGDHHLALSPLGEAALEHPHDEEVLAALLRSLSNVQGPAAALGRYDAYRQELIERLGSAPGPAVQAVHRELLGADRPQRSGVQHDVSTLLGRSADLSNLNQHLSRSRLVSVLGPGGIGKTRLAHALAHGAHRPVYFVELAATGSGEQVIRTIAATLGIRDSLATRQALTAEQRSDARGRIAQHLHQVPTLLVLDNCEHVVDAAADLVAYLLASVRDLQVLTTSRTPLRIAGEQVYPLAQLCADDARQLFRERALAARPGVVLEDDSIADVVARLDGLPLAIELAAAQVRTMPVAEITTRLANRFDLLRGGDRSAPDRHQTLLAVIDWSWNLLGSAAQEALMRLSIFQDGFTTTCAGAVLGSNATESLSQLLDQSLITVTENAHGLRYRMLETVRELALIRLRESGLVSDAQAAQHSWARNLCAEQATQLHGSAQLSAAAVLRSEEANLSDVLHHALDVGDRETALILLAALASFWTISGDHLRLIEYFEPVEKILTGWAPPAHLVAASRQALAVLATTAGMIPEWFNIPQTRRVLALVGSDSDEPFVQAMYLLAEMIHSVDERPLADRLLELTSHPQRFVAMSASALLASHIENAGDPARAVTILTDAISLAGPDDGPWLAATYRMMIAHLYTQLGEPAAAAPHARRALEVLERLAPMDDAIQCRAILAIADLANGNIDAAASIFGKIADLQRQGQAAVLGVIVTLGEAELALAQGKTDQGIALLHEALEAAPHRDMPDAMATDLSPWTLLGAGTALAAFAWHGPTESGQNLARRLTSLALRALDPDAKRHDFPVLGTVLFSLATWGLLREDERPAVVGQLLALADRFGYNRFLPSLRWEPVAAELSRRAPAVLEDHRVAIADSSRTELLRAAQQIIRATASVGNS